jgi:hypothetical protein
MSRGGAFGLLLIILAACAFSLLLTPGLQGLIASSVLLAMYVVCAGWSLVRRGEGS